MKILIMGVSGFIGRNLYRSLSENGHKVTGCSRTEVPGINWKAFSFNSGLQESDIDLADYELLINAIGIYQQTPDQRYSQIHDDGPKKLFDACEKNNLPVIQISAIGAESEQPVSDFLRTKKTADSYLLDKKIPAIVLYPGIVLGEHGSTTAQLSLIARLPCMPLAFGRNKSLPLISIDQLTVQISDIIKHWPESVKTKVLIARPETMEQLFNNLRHWMGLGKGCFFPVPNKLVKLMFNLFPKFSIGALNKQSLDMMSEFSNQVFSPVTDKTASASLTEKKISGNFNKNLRLKTLFYVNLIILGIIWIVSGLSSLISFDQSRELISQIGLNGAIAGAIIITAAITDIFLGVLLWVPKLRRPVIIIQIIFIIIYSFIISIFIPIFWLHPFAPIIKNLAMIVLAFYLLIEEKE